MSGCRVQRSRVRIEAYKCQINGAYKDFGFLSGTPWETFETFAGSQLIVPCVMLYSRS